MKKIFLPLLLCILSLNSAFAQIKLIKGVVKSEVDSVALDSSLVILANDHYDRLAYSDSKQQKSFYHVLTDSAGRFEFRDVKFPGIRINDTLEEDDVIYLRVYSNHHDTHYEDLYITNDTIELELYLPSLYFVDEDTIPAKPILPKLYWRYGNFILLGNTLFDANAYRTSYKVGFSYNKNYKVFKSNYLGWELSPILYRRSYIKNDSLYTSPTYPKEYLASIQSGFSFYARTHFFSWNQKRNAFYMDLGAEYNLPWHYWHIEKPDRNTKYTFKNFHKYNEFYLNARIGMIKGLALKGQYRLTDIFKNGYTELPKWSVELQAVFLIGEWDED